MAAASNDIPRLQQLIRQAVRDKAGIASIIHKVELSIEGAYHVCGYNEKSLDVALLVLRMGGRQLLYAMSRFSTIPSIATLRRHRIFTRIMPSPGAPTEAEIAFNIREVVLSKLDQRTNLQKARSGFSILWDEISIEEVSCYFEHSDSIGGLCREHSHTVRTRLSQIETAENIADALFEKRLHLGREASVIAIGSFGTTPVLRGALPIAVSPTCKQETPEMSAEILERVIRCCVTPEMIDKVGQLWSFASDGDAGRRAMLYAKFLKHEVTTQHELFPYVGSLPGLNLLVGDHDITGDFDWKHILKREELTVAHLSK